MIITTRNQAELQPFVVIEAIPRTAGGTDGDPETGTYMEYVPRTTTTSHNDYRVTIGEGVTWTNLTPETLNTYDFPLVQRVDTPAESVGRLRFEKRGVAIRKNLQIAEIGTPDISKIPKAVLPSTLLTFFHNLTVAKASASGKNNYRYRTKGGSGVPVGYGNAYLTLEPNTDCWMDYDMSGVPIWNSSGYMPGYGGGPQHGGVLLQCSSNRVLAEAEHFASPLGTKFVFMQPDGQRVERTSIGINKRPSGANNAQFDHLNEITGDIRIHILDAPVPPTIKSYPIVGSWATITRSTGSPGIGWKTPKVAECPFVAMYLDQTRRAWFVGSYASDATISTYSVAAVTWNGSSVSLTHHVTACTGLLGSASDFSTALQALTHDRHMGGVAGDSGSALFVPLSSSSLAVLTCLANPGSGPAYEETRLNALIASACQNAGIPAITVVVALSPI